MTPARYRRLRTATRWAASPLLAALVAVALAYLLAAWLDCSTSASQDLCIAPALLAWPQSAANNLRLRRLRWRLCAALKRAHRHRLAQARSAARQLQAEDTAQRIERQMHDALKAEIYG